MIQGRDFVVFSDDWGRHPSSCQHLMKRFLPQNRILWVNSVGLRQPSLSVYDLRRGFEKLNEWRRPFVQAEKNLWVYSPVSLPWNTLPVVRRWNRQVGLNGVRKILKRLGFSKPISLTTVPNACDWIGELGETLKIYYCVDDFSEWPGMKRKSILDMEKDLLSKVDLFLATSKKLLESKKPSTEQALLLPHGVDLDHFKQAYSGIEFSGQGDSPPHLGYVGVIDERLDFDLLLYLIHERPKWIWIFVGPVMSCPRELRRSENCRFLPPVSYAELPNALRSLDGLLMPYKVNRLTETINPLKLREYLATGKPVVATQIPEIGMFSDLLSIASSKEEFVKRIEEIIQNKSRVKPKDRWKRLESESWESRAEILSQEIERRTKLIRILELRCVRGSGGGPEKTIFLTAKKINPDRFQTDIIYIRAKTDPEFNLMRKHFLDPKVSYHEVVEHHPFDFSLVSEILRFCQANKIDLIHSHEYKTDVLAALVRRKWQGKWISTFHSECQGSLKLWFYQMLGYRALKKCDLVFAVSQELRGSLFKHGVSSAKIELLVNGIDTEAFKRNSSEMSFREKRQIPPSRTVIGFVGRLSKEKNIPLLLRVFKQLLDEGFNVETVLAGEGPEKEKLLSLVRQLEIHPRVHFLGFREDTREIYMNLDIFAQSSENEGMSNSILEAMAMELPVVATAVGGIPELIKHGQEGFLCQPGNEIGFCESLKLLASDPEKRKEMGRKGREKVLRHFSFQDRVRRLENFYERLVRSRN
jgi:glycosyltransferase involved in cell wall biosynthesis